MQPETQTMERNSGEAAQTPLEQVAPSRAVTPTASVPLTKLGRRLRILHVFSFVGLGGTELTALRIIASLDPQRFENLVCGLRGFDANVAPVRYPGIQLVPPSARDGKSSPSVSSLLDIIRTHKPDIVHSRNWGAIESVPAAWFARVPAVVHSEHGYEMDTLTSLPLRRRVFRRFAYGLADVVFAVTDELRKFHARQAWVSSGRIRVLTNGVDTEVFAPQPHVKTSARGKLNIPVERFVIGSLGRMVPIKNHVAILKAAESLLLRGIDAHALLVGSGPELQTYKSYVKQAAELAGRVTFLGATEKVAEALSAMDAFVLPSFSEGMSNTLLEAMSCGMPVVATRVGGNPEVVEANCSGLLVNSGETEELADCLTQLAQDAALRERLGAAARARILEKFSLQRMVSAYSQLYLDLGERAGVL